MKLDTAIFVSDFGSFTINSMVVGDNIGSATMSFGTNSSNKDLNRKNKVFFLIK